MVTKDYDTCYQCGCDVVCGYNPWVTKWFTLCTNPECDNTTHGFSTEREAKLWWKRAWDYEWESYSNKTIYKI